MDIPDSTLTEFVLEHAASRGAKPALVDAATGRTVSYADLAAAVQTLAARLAGQGVRPGDVLALCAPNSIEFAVTLYAASAAGATVATISPQLTSQEIADQLRRTGARWLVTAAEPVEHAEAFLIGDGGVSLHMLPGRWDDGREISPDVALLLTSSGTTGLPKRVMLSHRGAVADLCQLPYAHHVTRHDVVLVALPMTHNFGMQVSLNLSLRAGATVVILPRFETGAFLRAIQEHKVTRVEVVPPMMQALASTPETSDYDLSSLRMITCAAASLRGELARALAARTGCRIKQGYGMTETSGGTHLAPDDGPDRPESVGPPLPGVECRVVEPGTSTDVQPGVPGELLVRGPGVMLGYLADQAATADAIDKDGWLRTGDIVTVDEDGWYYITDRVKELIKYKGHQVGPVELEALLQTHPAVADAAVVGSPDLVAGEVPKAFVVPRAPVTAAELIEWTAAQVAPYKRIRLVEFTDTIPRSPGGKILRRMLTGSSVSHRAPVTGHCTGRSC